MEIGRVYNNKTKRYSKAVLGSRDRYKHLYTVYRAIIARCDNPKMQDYINYGGRGVTYTSQWKEFSNFVKDVDKIDGWNLSLFDNYKIQLDKDYKVKGNKLYSKETCMWVSIKKNGAYKPTQQSNLRPKIAFDVVNDKIYEFKSPNKFANNFDVSVKTIQSSLIYNKWFSNGVTFWYKDKGRESNIVYFKLILNDHSEIVDTSLLRLANKSGINPSTLYSVFYGKTHYTSMFLSIKEVRVSVSELLLTKTVIKLDY